MQKSDSMAPEYELDGHASSLIYAFKRGAKHLTDIFAYSKWTLPQKGSLLVDHVIISNCPSTRRFNSRIGSARFDLIRIDVMRFY